MEDITTIFNWSDIANYNSLSIPSPTSHDRVGSANGFPIRYRLDYINCAKTIIRYLASMSLYINVASCLLAHLLVHAGVLHHRCVCHRDHMFSCPLPCTSPCPSPCLPASSDAFLHIALVACLLTYWIKHCIVLHHRHIIAVVAVQLLARRLGYPCALPAPCIPPLT